MAYFSNGIEGSALDEQCSRCRYGKKPCPIWQVQTEFNYEACDNKTAGKILSHLISNDGSCTMFKMFRGDFSIADTPLFPELTPKI